jgi:hypothetical protein
MRKHKKGTAEDIKAGVGWLGTRDGKVEHVNGKVCLANPTEEV